MFVFSSHVEVGEGDLTLLVLKKVVIIANVFICVFGDLFKDRKGEVSLTHLQASSVYRHRLVDGLGFTQPRRANGHQFRFNTISWVSFRVRTDVEFGG